MLNELKWVRWEKDFSPQRPQDTKKTSFITDILKEKRHEEIFRHRLISYLVASISYSECRGWTAKRLNGETVKSGQENGGKYKG